MEGLKLAREKLGFDIEAEKMIKAALEGGATTDAEVEARSPRTFVKPKAKSAAKSPASNASTI
eukprot:5296688-Pyramimonas_sp.AAC.1